ncbi:protein-tyrosine phosphatase family protein [Streptomyces sp. NPDC050161]|uniref:protein-tyrosine phosphatase family protein n=1 Tax=Streptomyces sp. NPDC050161 TaxID=3365604 RepID=UPI0037B0A8DF
MWIPWRDFWLPADPDDAIRKLRLAYERAASERIEVCCGGGVGRTGTALSVMCVFEGMDPEEAVIWMRRNYHPRAVEVPWQRRFIRRAFTADAPGSWQS